MNILLSLLVILLPFSAFLLFFGRQAFRPANNETLALANSNQIPMSSSAFDVVQPTLNPIRPPIDQQGNSETVQFRAKLQAGIEAGETINVALTLDQLEVIADALEITGEYIEEELVDTTEGSEVHGLLIEDRRNVTATMNVVSGALEACPS
jgi:hypothetical protein